MSSEVLVLLGCIGRSQSLADAIRHIVESGKAREDKVPRSLLAAEAWRAQVHWVDYAWRVFCYSCALTYSLVD